MGADDAKGRSSESEASKPFQRGGEKDVSSGPVKDRGCTDIFCILIFAAAWVGFFFLTFANSGDGNPQKLFRPRDFRGDFCALEEQWASNLNLASHEKLTYMMNVTAAVDITVTQMLCSDTTATRLQSVLSGEALTDYLCSCCLSPCTQCYSARTISQYESHEAMEADVIERLAELSGRSSGGASITDHSLYSPTGANGDLFKSIFYGDSPYFVQVCTRSCSDTVTDPNRIYRWQPPADHELRAAWEAATTSGIISPSVFNAFQFEAVSSATCPYEEKYCIPWQGVEFNEMDFGHCEFKMSQDVVAAIGATAASVLEEDGVRAVREDMGSTLGDAVGDFTDTLDAFAVTAVCGFLIGLIFLVLMRFCVGVCVWFSIFVVVLLFIAAGALAWLRSGQCAGAGLLETGKQTSQAIATAAESTVTNGFDLGSESISGNGEDYRGVQRKSSSGKTCRQWSTTTYTATAYPDAGLTSNYCRNPAGEAPTIWCFTTDPDVYWETCDPLYVFQGECHEGYEVSNSDMRQALEISAYVIWGLGLLFMIIIGCMFRALRLAIAVNKVAAMFVYHKPAVLFVPMVQVLCAILWCLLWALSVSFLVSQVPDDHVPKEYFATYNEAFGTEDTPGKCTDMVPQGFVYKDEGDFTANGNPCSGNMGVFAAGEVAKCWRCGQPRYAITLAVWYSFFVYLWNNAFLVAVGQCTIAGACSAWFFAPRDDKRNVQAVRTGLWNCFRYHLGSLAFGAFIIAVVQFIRYVMKYFEKQAQAQKNYLCAAILKVAQCMVACFERCLKFLNRNAYIQIALLGKNFCTSAKNALMLIIRNFRRFAAVVALGSVIQFVGLMFICAGTTVVGYFIIKALHPDIPVALPVCLYFVMSYLIAQLYMNVFALATDTMLQCFIAAEEMGGDDDFVPGPLKNLLPAGPKQDAIKEGAEADDPGSTE
mmetsp:Transcript_55222/g.131634  ORF Transcript_55222/g.131634 Transcript_55222/m.131634 type:complete len:935 (-) Transcript_55222:224-3028(-)|eukprot:CAMPEP_0178434504 /NCGR_PEP_ID=MMETSP0689_2-20121128/33457_1 /TAXON_ID=160604 /ORGANISM="Amphidinium massartii, Strain CS-259" /LENGTH=934 /DNA_ID=CAMNT_0020056569 /DNA_START=85 /DNA_END=2889 /DNA_ORIENTATION=+